MKIARISQGKSTIWIRKKELLPNQKITVWVYSIKISRFHETLKSNHPGFINKTEIKQYQDRQVTKFTFDKLKELKLR